MELLKAIQQRRAVRDYTDAEVSPGIVRDVIRAATFAPSAMNLQPWAFAVFHGRERLVRYSRRAKAHLLATTDPSFGLDPRIDQYANVGANLFHGADTLVLICARPGRFVPVEDCFLAAQNFMLAAHGFGLGTCPVGFARSWFNRPEVKAELSIPPHFEAVLPIVLGHPAHPAAEVPRDEPEIVGWHWDEKP
jgi:nitroreductase